VDIRPETPEDAKAIAEVVAAAFGRELEATLVQAIRACDRFVPDLSLVALVEAQVVGHIMFSYADLVGEADVWRVLLLSPLAVLPEFQRRGVGSALVKGALRVADERHEPLVIVEGIPAYYPRLGFKRAQTIGIEPPHPVPDGAFLAIPLSSYDPALRGKVIYPSAFDIAV
jgi:putative acetyltransferase